MDSRSFVRSFVRDAISGDLRIRFFWNLALSCILASLKKCSKRIFEKNSRSPPGVVLTENPLFGWKMAFWAYIFETAHQMLMIFSQIIAFNDLTSVLCARKFSFAPQGGFTPWKCPLLAKMAYNGPFELIFSQLRIRFWWFLHIC